MQSVWSRLGSTVPRDISVGTVFLVFGIVASFIFFQRGVDAGEEGSKAAIEAAEAARDAAGEAREDAIASRNAAVEARDAAEQNSVELADEAARLSNQLAQNANLGTQNLGQLYLAATRNNVSTCVRPRPQPGPDEEFDPEDKDWKDARNAELDRLGTELRDAQGDWSRVISDLQDFQFSLAETCVGVLTLPAPISLDPG